MPPDASKSTRPPRRFEPWHLLAVLAVVLLVHTLLGQLSDAPTWSYSRFTRELAAGHVAEVTVSADAVRGTLKPAPGQKRVERFHTVRMEDHTLLAQLKAQGVEVTGVAPPDWLARAWPWLLGAFLLLPWLLSRMGMGAEGHTLAPLEPQRVHADVQ